MTLSDADARLIRQAETRLGVIFQEPTLLLQALTHRSALNELTGWLTPSNERLEFLGDAVLGYLCAHYLYERFPDSPEGELTARRAALIRTSTLADWARQLDLATVMRVSQGELTGGNLRESLLADAFEAILAAILLDQGWPAAEGFLKRWLDQHADRLIKHGVRQNYKGWLQEIVQEREHVTPNYRTVAVAGPDHESLFTVEVVVGTQVLGRGTGRSKQSAQQEAAHQALVAYQVITAKEEE